MPLVSVIIPTYNRKLLLSRAVNSVLGQTFKDFELIVVDDASTDATAELAVIKGALHQISYCCLPTHKGVSAARNYGVGRAQGAWIAFLDSDDEWLPKKLEKQMAWHALHGEYRIFQTQEIWIRGGVRVNAPKTHAKIHGFQFEENLRRCMITPSSVVMEKKLFLEEGGFNEDLIACEDYDLWLRVTANLPVGLVDEQLLRRYGGHGDQLSATTQVMDKFRIVAMENILKDARLTHLQREQVIFELCKKATIVAEGFNKRGNEIDYAFYKRIAERYAGN